MKIEFPSEPEAASVHCRDRELKLGTLKTGDIYLNLDLGGGTADMAVHQVDKDNNLTSLAVSGGKWGSCFIDEQFELWLHEVFTRTVVDTYKRENQQDYLDLMETFEQRKILFDPKSEDSIVVAFPSSFPDFVIEQLGKTTGQMIQEYTNRPVGPDHNEGKVDLLRGKLRLSRELMLKFFEVVVRPMIGEVRDLVTRHNCKYIFLVGAFGESEVVKARIRREFPGKRLVSPPRAGLAIVKGGARWGLEPSVISSRVLERSWGIEMWEEQQPADRRNGRITETDQDGTVRVARFKCFLRAGTTVKTGHAATHTIFMFNDSPTITLPVFTSGMVCTPRYPDECDDTFASLKLTAPPGQIIRDKEAFAITFQAGANEITAMARRKKTGHKVKCELNFMNFWSSDENA